MANSITKSPGGLAGINRGSGAVPTRSARSLHTGAGTGISAESGIDSPQTTVGKAVPKNSVPQGKLVKTSKIPGVGSSAGGQQVYRARGKSGGVSMKPKAMSQRGIRKGGMSAGVLKNVGKTGSRKQMRKIG